MKNEEKDSMLFDTIKSGVAYRGGVVYTKEALVNLFQKQERRVKEGSLTGGFQKGLKNITHVISNLSLREEGDEVCLEIGAMVLETPTGKLLKETIEKRLENKEDLNLEFFLDGYCTKKDGKITNILLNFIGIRPKVNSKEVTG
jgi:hypothetical protein